MSSLRKKFVNAFESYAARWNDSKSTTYTWSKAHHKNARQWARCMTSAYFYDNGELAVEFPLEWYDIESIDHVTQEDVDDFVYEEISCF